MEKILKSSWVDLIVDYWYCGLKVMFSCLEQNKNSLFLGFGKTESFKKKGKKTFNDLKVMFGLKMIWKWCLVCKWFENDVWFENDLKIMFGLKMIWKWCWKWKWFEMDV